ncbi:MAG TPA: polysaccharide biosynthesis/export family protein, partial [Tenuifilaceae bacterium]|nr:polysaccharide biosynthesis/export family protein [Tenuifilaceae bacterium]
MKGTRRVNLVIFATMLVATVVSSCNKRSQLLYVSNLANESLVRKQQEQYRLKEGDVLYVQILTRDPQVSSMFNNRGLSGTAATNMYTNDASYYLFGYSVSDSGTVQLPVLGKLFIKDLTVEQARSLIQTETEKYLTDGLAVVKLLSYKITVLGEVKRPGVYTNF